MSVLVRPGTLADIRQLAEIAGGATTPETLANWMDDGSAYAAWHVAEDEMGALLGFQRIGPEGEPARGICEIATFLRKGVALSAGSRLFDATAEAAQLMGYEWIEARITGTNEGARTYYQSRGFRIWHESASHLFMRYELD